MKKLDLYIRSERLIGCTVPSNGIFFVCDHDEVWKVTISDLPQIELIDDEPYPFAERDDFIGWGSTSERPLKRAGESEIEYKFKGRDYVDLKFRVHGQKGQLRFTTFSGDWFSASLSDDGRHLVMIEPYLIELFATVE